MSITTKELLHELIEKLPDEKLGYVIAFVQGMLASQEADELHYNETNAIEK